MLWVDWDDAMRAPGMWDAAGLAATSLVFGDHDYARAALKGARRRPANPQLKRLVRVRVLQTVPCSALVAVRGANRVASFSGGSDAADMGVRSAPDPHGFWFERASNSPSNSPLGLFGARSSGC